MFVGCRLFKIMVYLSRMYFWFARVSYLRVIILVDFLSNSCLYEFNMDGTKLLSVDFNEMFVFLIVDTLGTVPHCHSVLT